MMVLQATAGYSRVLTAAVHQSRPGLQASRAPCRAQSMLGQAASQRHADELQLVLPDISLDDVLAGIRPGDVPAGTPPKPEPPNPATQKPSRRRGRKNKQESPKVIMPDQSQPADKAGGPSKVAARLARMLQSANTSSIATPPRTEPSASDEDTSIADMHSPSRTNAAVVVDQPTAIDLDPVQQLLTAPISSLTSPSAAQQSFGLLHTSHKRRSRLFNLGQTMAVPRLSGSTTQHVAMGSQQGPELTTADEHTGIFIASTRQPRRRIKQSIRGGSSQDMLQGGVGDAEAAQHVANLKASRHDLSRSSTQGRQEPQHTPVVQLDSWFTTAPLLLDATSDAQHKRRSVGHHAPQPPELAAQQSQGSLVSTGSSSSSRGVSLGSRGSSTAASSSGSEVSHVPMEMHTWCRVAAEEWPRLFTPDYHTSLYEFLLDVWIEASKALDRQRPSDAVAACDLLVRCWESCDTLVRHTALIAAADGLVDQEGLQQHVAAVTKHKVELHNALVEAMAFLHQDELQQYGGLEGWTPMGVAKARQRKRTGRTSVADDSWRQLTSRLQALQFAHPSAALGPLVSVLDTSCWPG